ncbi:MAG TPA: ATP-binding protein, partial [Thermoanaerobaculia bacterium]|nr:ATP-binding protein [Thermoanaerobaculia bacterium]
MLPIDPIVPDLEHDTAATPGGSLPEAARKQDLQALWRFYERRMPGILDRVYGAVLERPEWRPIYGDASTFAAQQRHVLDLLRQAVVGDRWEPYLAYLRGRGAAFARHGIGYSAWLELIGAFRNALRGEAERFPEETPGINRLAARQVNRGVNFLLDTIRRTVVEAYLGTREELLASGESQYRSMFDNSPLPMWMYDRESLRIVAVNEAAVRHYGYRREEFLALSIADLRPADELPALADDVRRAKGLAAPRLWRHRKKDGGEITVEVTAHDFELDGKPVRLVLAQDVTEREQAKLSLTKTESQLRHTQKMEAVARLAGGVAHDMNNILTAIQGYAALLEEDLEPEDPRRGDAQEIRRASERAEAITRQLLTLSRHSMAKPRPIDLGPLIDDFLPMLRRLVGDQVVVSTHLRTTAPVVADPGQIEQVLMNLAVNARDAMPDGGRLIVETQEIEVDEEGGRMRGLSPGRYAVVMVTDTGTGIDAETRERIFEPFFTTKEEGKGTGLGLSIVHGIVAQAGGSVRLYSEPGHGSTFRVHLPAAAQGAA